MTAAPPVPAPPFAVGDVDTSGFAGHRVVFAASRTGTLHAAEGRGCHHAATAQRNGTKVEVVVPDDALTTGWEPERRCCGGADVFGALTAARALTTDWRTLDELRTVLTGTPTDPARLLELLDAARKLAAAVTRTDEGTWQPAHSWETVPAQRITLGGWAADLVAAAPAALTAAEWLPAALTEHVSVHLPLAEIAALRAWDRRPNTPAAQALTTACWQLGKEVRDDVAALAAAAGVLLAERLGRLEPTRPAGVDPAPVAAVVDLWRDELAERAAAPEQIIVWRGRFLDPPLADYQELLGYAFDVVDTADSEPYGSQSFGFLTARLPLGIAVALGPAPRVDADPCDDHRVIAALAADLPSTPFAEIGDPATRDVLVDAAHPRSLHARLARARAAVGATPTDVPAVPAAGQQVTATLTVTFTVADPAVIAAASEDALIDAAIAAERAAKTRGEPGLEPSSADAGGGLVVNDAAEDLRAGLRSLLTRAMPAPQLPGLNAGPVTVEVHGPAFAPPPTV
ncbi:hypothetical protein [Blastococcus mobilis]|uniref:Uncharacterized protein n=1 Tax=Blastococcus mobilis TaxID=1938746 RepID=A0A238ZTR6_9ACTN|nr:hypothetical protein [Blastococcus mobilis]SNR86053.1 hypothetical protein SAMN06272737_13224 [Blastococcus mobilis]